MEKRGDSMVRWRRIREKVFADEGREEKKRERERER